MVFLTIGYFEWYGVPVVAVTVILAAIGLDRLTRLCRTAAVAVPATVLALAYAIQIPFTLPLEARVQHEIEDKVRQPLGGYLGEVRRPARRSSPSRRATWATTRTRPCSTIRA